MGMGGRGQRALPLLLVSLLSFSPPVTPVVVVVAVAVVGPGGRPRRGAVASPQRPLVLRHAFLGVLDGEGGAAVVLVPVELADGPGSGILRLEGDGGVAPVRLTTAAAAAAATIR